MKAPKVDGANTGEIMTQDDKDQYNSPEFLAKTAERLEALGGKPEPVVVPVVDPEPDPAEVDDPAKVASPTPTVETDPVVDTDVVSTDTVKDSEEEEPAIPEQLFRAATHSQWKPEEITDFWKSNPELAKRTFSKMHDDMVSVNNQYAEQGRAAKVLQAQKEELEQHVTQSITPVKPKGFVDIDRAREEFGDGAATIIEQLNNALIEVTKHSTPVQQVDTAQQEKNVTRTEKSLAVVQQMSHWFANPAMKSYEKYYGSGVDVNGFPLITSEHLTQEQRNHRSELLDKAGDIEAGIGLRGGTVSVADALTMAHTIVTKDVQTEMVRKGIIDSAKKKAAGVTLRPSGKKVVPIEILKPGEKKTEKQLFADTDRRLKALMAGKSMV